MGRHRPLFFGLIALTLAVGGCRSSKPAGSAQADNGTLAHPDFVMKPFNIQSYGADGLEWRLNAPEAQAFTAMNILNAVQVDLLLYEKGRKSTAIRSDKGSFCLQSGSLSNSLTPDERVALRGHPLVVQGNRLQSGDMFLSGHVVVVSTDGTKLLTDWLHYQRSREVITSTAPVRVIRDDSITTGVGLEATANLGSVKIFNQTLIIKGDDETPAKK